MKDSLAPETPPKVNFTEFNVQQDRGKPHFIRLNDGVVQRLERQLKDGSAGHRHGLLIGSVEASGEAGDSCTIAVEDYEPVDAIEDRLRSWKPSDRSAYTVVGYYRTHPDADFRLNLADQGLLERGFPKGSRLALLVTSPGADIATAKFFLGENGRLSADRATVEFPFNLRELGAEEAPAPVPAAAPVAVPKPAAPKPAPVVAAAPALKLPAAPAPAAPAPVAPVSVASKAKAGVSRILVKVGFAGVVVIASVFGLSELRVFEQPSGERKPMPVLAKAQAAQPEPVATPEPVAAPPKAVETKAASANPVPAIKPAVAAVKQATPPATKKAKPAAESSAPSEPALIAENRAPKPAISLPSTPAPVPAPAQAVERPRVSPPTVAAPPTAPVETPQTRAALLPITPPRAIRSYPPVLTESLRRDITREVSVRVKVTLDESGRITGVEPVEGSGPMHPGLARLAVAAVKRWEFEPARRGAERVPGDITLSFIFRK